MANSSLKKIKVFIASSRELREDRDALSRLIASLNHFYTEKGIYIQTYMYEDEDSNYSGRKQDEYDSNIADSDIFICLFWTKAGQYTVEEFDVACVKYKENQKPAIYIYLKDNTNAIEEQTLTDFKDRLEKEIGHFPDRYTHIDTLKFDFLTKWIKFNPVIDFTAISVRNETVFIHQTPTTINVSKIDFVRNNDEYSNILKKIEKAQERVCKYPNDEDFVNELRELKESQAEFESSIIDTAVMISKLENQHSSARLDEAIELFKEGNHKAAMSILNKDLIIDDIESNIDKLEKLNHIRSEYQSNLKTHVDELMLKASLIVNSFSLSKFEEAESIHSYILSILDKLDNDSQKEVMFNIAITYEKSYNHHKAIELLNKLKKLDLDKRQQVLVFGRLGENYIELHNYRKAAKCFSITATICEKDKYNCVTNQEISHLILQYLRIARLLDMTEDGDYGKMIEVAMSMSNEAYGNVINDKTAIFHLYYSLYLIEQCGDKEKGYERLKKIQNTLESIGKDDCKIQLAQIYQIFSQLYIKSDLPEQLAQGYKYSIDSMSIFKNMKDDEIYSKLNLYLRSIAIASQYENKNKNYMSAINIASESLNKIHILSRERRNSFSSEIIEVLYNGISASLESRINDECFDLSWLSRFLPMVFTTINQTRYQSDSHSLFGKEYLIIASILKGIDFESNKTLELKFEKLLLDLCISEFSSYNENENIIEYTIIICLLMIGENAASHHHYKEILYYAKEGIKLIDILVRNIPDFDISMLPSFIVAMVELIPYFDEKLDFEIKLESYNLLKEADNLYLQLEDMDSETKDSYVGNCNNLSLLAIEQCDINYGLELILRALTLSPDNTMLLDTFGEICININEMDRINLIIEKILYLDNKYFVENNTPFAIYVNENNLLNYGSRTK